jgi:FtsH-binding integral membrane protein
MAAERWWHSVAIGLLHLILFGFAFGIGFVLEVFVSRYYQGSHLAAFSPCIAATAFLMGLLVNRTRKDRTPSSSESRAFSGLPLPSGTKVAFGSTAGPTNRRHNI